MSLTPEPGQPRSPTLPTIRRIRPARWRRCSASRTWSSTFPIRRGIFFKRQIGSVQAVEGVSLEVRKGETLGLVGETGCGKSTLARCITRLHPLTSGRIVFDGVDVSRLSPRQMRPYRRRMQIILQDPYGSLKPRRRVGSDHR